jgi:hypothetical protein
MVWQCVVLPGRHTLTVVEGMLKKELAAVGPGPTSTDAILPPLDELLLDELLLEDVPLELLLEELLLEELLEPLGGELELLPPPQAVRAMAASSGSTRPRLGNMRISLLELSDVDARGNQAGYIGFARERSKPSDRLDDQVRLRD